MKSILAVDDDSANLIVINGILSSKYKVYPVTSGQAALRFLEKQRPDLILLDIEMPEMNGIELFEKIKADITGIPVIFLTMRNDMENEAAAFRRGAADYMRKPVNDVILHTRVAVHLELAALRAEKGVATFDFS